MNIHKAINHVIFHLFGDNGAGELWIYATMRHPQQIFNLARYLYLCEWVRKWSSCLFLCENFPPRLEWKCVYACTCSHVLASSFFFWFVVVHFRYAVNSCRFRIKARYILFNDPTHCPVVSYTSTNTILHIVWNVCACEVRMPCRLHHFFFYCALNVVEHCMCCFRN